MVGFSSIEMSRPVGVLLPHAVPLRIAHRVAEEHAAVDVGHRPLQRLGEALAVEDVVAENEGHRIVTDVVGADDERLGQAVRRGLFGVADLQAPLAAVTEQPLEAGVVLRGGDHQDVPDAGEHEHRQRVVDHRFVEHRQQLLGHRTSDRMQTRTGAACQDDPLHRLRATHSHLSACWSVTCPDPSGAHGRPRTRDRGRADPTGAERCASRDGRSAALTLRARWHRRRRCPVPETRRSPCPSPPLDRCNVPKP